MEIIKWQKFVGLPLMIAGYFAAYFFVRVISGQNGWDPSVTFCSMLFVYCGYSFNILWQIYANKHFFYSMLFLSSLIGVVGVVVGVIDFSSVVKSWGDALTIGVIFGILLCGPVVLYAVSIPEQVRMIYAYATGNYIRIRGAVINSSVTLWLLEFEGKFIVQSISPVVDPYNPAYVEDPRLAFSTTDLDEAVQLAKLYKGYYFVANPV